MMQELSLGILDIAQNSVKAGATLIELSVKEDSQKNELAVTIADNGCGMDEETAKRAADPFYTTRTTRKVGLGLSFFKMSAQLAGGSFELASEPGKGTVVFAVFGLNHIDRMPLGDMRATMNALISCNPHLDFVYTHERDGAAFVLDTREMRKILGDISLAEPEVLAFIADYVTENDV